MTEMKKKYRPITAQEAKKAVDVMQDLRNLIVTILADAERPETALYVAKLMDEHLWKEADSAINEESNK